VKQPVLPTRGAKTGFFCMCT